MIITLHTTDKLIYTFNTNNHLFQKAHKTTPDRLVFAALFNSLDQVQTLSKELQYDEIGIALERLKNIWLDMDKLQLLL